jgi:hypothetical protein
MPAIEKIINKLSGFLNLKFGRVGNRLEIEKPNPEGFPLTFIEEKDGFTVRFRSNHWHFDEESESLDYLAFGLSRKCRLREIIRGSPHKWIVEQEDHGGWKPMNEMGLLFFRFWKENRKGVPKHPFRLRKRRSPYRDLNGKTGRDAPEGIGGFPAPACARRG